MQPPLTQEYSRTGITAHIGNRRRDGTGGEPGTAFDDKRILVLSVSAGAGHVRAAQAICAHAAEIADGVEATHIDAIDYVSQPMRLIYTSVYLSLVRRYPALWRQVYQVTDAARSDSRLQRLRRGIERLGARALVREVVARQPAAVICTHFLPAEVLVCARRRGELACPIWVQVTDFDVHRMWIHKDVTGYFAANDEVAHRIQSHGVPAEQVRVTGIPVMPSFGALHDRGAAQREQGLDPGRLTILLMGGGAGLGGLEALASDLLQAHPSCQILALAGRNADALRALREMAQGYAGRLVAIGYTDHVAQWMRCADIAVTKPGGLTVSECLATGLPMILHGAIPGQEERNADFLLEQGVALKAGDAQTLAYRVRQLLDDPGKLADMRRRALQLARPNAAQDVLATVLGNCFG